MTTITFREQLHKQIDRLPDDVVQQIADFTFFIVTRRKLSSDYTDWQPAQWQDFTLAQFFREGDEVEYTLKDAQEVYHP